MKEGTSIIFVNSGGSILLFLRDNISSIPYPGCWDILGGNVEENETPEECIVREMDEEIEVKLDINQLNLFKAYTIQDRKEYTFWQHEDFKTDEMVLHEGQCLKWFTKDEIIDMNDSEISFGFKEIILDFFNQAPYKDAGS